MTTNEGLNEAGSTGTTHSDTTAMDTLVVVSKIKKFIRETSGMNTSKDAIDALTIRVTDDLRRGIENARTAGRKTVMARDIAS